ncbi:MAG: GPMC system MBL fold metallohydrolase [Desulfuromonadales bacterium]|nr:GPMC system MBL fold metallohydrolase [Desulfuromonadales bacterium]
MNRSAGTLLILGSGTSTGVPMIGCRCPVCRSADPRNQRSRCSALIRGGGQNILIDSATDLRFQALREGVQQIDAVLYTHTHADHVHGIDDLRSFNRRNQQSLPLYGSPACVATLQRSFPYIFMPGENSGFRPRLHLETITGPFFIGVVPIIPLPIEHGDDLVLGYRIGTLAYLTDCNRVPPTTRKALHGITTLVIDALRFSPHPTHFTIAEAIAFAQDCGIKRTILTHLSHDVDARQHGAALPDGIEFAYDGQVIPFLFTPS